MVPIKQVADGFNRYVQNNIVAKVSGLPAWGIGALSVLVADKATNLISQFADQPMVKALGIVDGQNVDIDALYKAVYPQAQKQDASIDFKLLGLNVGTLKLTAADVDALYKEIKGA